MQRCVHHLSSSDELIRLQVLDCLQLTMAALEGVDESECNIIIIIIIIIIIKGVCLIFRGLSASSP